MSGEVAVALGISAAAISALDTAPYIRDTLRGTTRPHRGTWLIWGVLGAVGFASQRADEATWSLLFVGTQTLLILAIFALSLKRGYGTLTRTNAAMLLLAGGGVVVWLSSSDPTVATAAVVGADLVGVAMMLPKIWADPDSETLSTYLLAALAGGLAALAVGTASAALLLYPIYFVVGNGAIAATIIVRRRRLARAATSSSAEEDDLVGRMRSGPYISPLRAGRGPAPTSPSSGVGPNEIRPLHMRSGHRYR
jgi:uncharacterized membrane protein HdeD (DUF308 family)